LIGENPPKNGFTSGAAFSPNSQFIGAAGLDHAIRVFRTDTGEVIETLVANTATDFVSFTPEGWYVSSESGKALLRLIRDHKELPTDQLLEKNHLDSLSNVTQLDVNVPQGASQSHTVCTQGGGACPGADALLACNLTPAQIGAEICTIYSEGGSQGYPSEVRHAVLLCWLPQHASGFCC
jgi:hypothetical protein